MAKKSSSKSKKPTTRKPARRKPKVTVRVGKDAREAMQEEDGRPLTLLALLIRLLPVWVLIAIILLLEPTLPLRAINGLGRLVGIGRQAEEAPVAEPVFIVEEAQGLPLQNDLPTPSWSLEISEVFTPEVQAWAEKIGEWSLTYRIKPNLIATLMQIESCGNPEAGSPAGAQGLFQVVPLHFMDDEDPYDPETNALRGLTYFAEVYAQANGDLGLALAAYNGGPGMISVSPADWPDETQAYQFWGSGIYEEAEMGLSESPTLQDWLDAGGNALCEQAADELNLRDDRR